jgi:hypothetical protein
MRIFLVQCSPPISVGPFPHDGLTHKDELDSAVHWLIRRCFESSTDYTSNNNTRL